MNFVKRLAAPGSIALLIASTFAGSAIADSLYNQTLPAPGFYNGTGVGADSFTTNSANGVTLGLSIKTQFGDTDTLVTTEDPGSANYQAPTGYGSHSYAGGTINYTNLAQWDYYFSVFTGPTPANNYDYKITLIDSTTGDVFSYNPLTDLGDNSGLDGSTNMRFGNGVSDPAEVGFQNAENIGFLDIGLPDWINGNMNDAATDIFLVNLAALDKTTGAELNSVTVSVNAPEPGTIGMMLGSLGALGMFMRRRRN